MITSGAVPAPLPAPIGVSQISRPLPVKTLPTPWEHPGVFAQDGRSVHRLLYLAANGLEPAGQTQSSEA
jgi:hypothetical protein